MQKSERYPSDCCKFNCLVCGQLITEIYYPTDCLCCDCIDKGYDCTFINSVAHVIDLNGALIAEQDCAEHFHGVSIQDVESDGMQTVYQCVECGRTSETYDGMKQVHVGLSCGRNEDLDIVSAETYCERCSVVPISTAEKYCSACTEDILQYLYQAEEDRRYLEEVERYAEDIVYSKQSNGEV